MTYMKPALWSKIGSAAGEQEFSQDLWNITEECEKKNWLVGLYTWEELERKYSGAWMPVESFSVWQSHKWRPIDDLSENGVNAAYSA